MVELDGGGCVIGDDGSHAHELRPLARKEQDRRLFRVHSLGTKALLLGVEGCWWEFGRGEEEGEGKQE